MTDKRRWPCSQPIGAPAGRAAIRTANRLSLLGLAMGLGAAALAGAQPLPAEHANIFHRPESYHQPETPGMVPPSSPTNMTFHGGPVMTSFTAYLIFWLPPGTHFSSSISDANYEQLITRYFEDIGGSPFYNIVTQYPGNNGTPANAVAFGGSIVDTHPYPRLGTAANPLLDSDLRAEISRVITEQSWPVGLGAMYFLFTGSGVQSCFNSTHTDCSQNNYCAYHTVFSLLGQPVIYANMPDAFSLGDCGSANVTGDPSADVEISVVSHEHFEAVTDPTISAWFDGGFGEIGDKCAYTYGPGADSTTPNLFLNGHPYRVQREWSNAVGDCALSLCGTSVCPPDMTQSITATTCIAGATGNAIHYTLQYQNSSDVDAATGVSIVDTLPAGVHWASGTAPSSTLGNVLRFNRPDVGVHQGGTFQFTATVTSPPPAFTTLANNVALTFSDSLSNSQPAVVASAASAAPCGPWCGNGAADPGEQCDDGNPLNGDGCDANCTITACGNSLVTAGEQCDDGNVLDGDGCSAACAIESCTPPPAGVLAWWSADGSASDISGGHHGTLQNGAAFAAGRSGQAFSLDGSDDYVSIPDDAAWDLGSSSFTIQLWLNYASVNDTQSFVTHRDWPAADGWSLQRFLGNVEFFLQGAGVPGGSVSLFSYAWAPTAGTWHHLAVTRTGSNYTLYVDGSPVSAATDTTTIPTISTALTLGSLAGQSEFFAGDLDDVQIIDHALDATEVQAIYRNGTAGQCKDCTAAGVPDGASCTDGLFCNGADSCQGGTCSFHAGNPCTGRTECDNTCNEAAGNCFVTAGTACASDANLCTVDQCDGAGMCAHTAGNAGAACRAAAGVCDVAETCTGTATTCPPDDFQPTTVTCRAAVGFCDIAEHCTGSGPICPPDAFQSSLTCRPSAGVCDVAENCTGNTTACSPDRFAPATLVCRPTAGACDPTESCTGSSAACPADVAHGPTVGRPRVVLKKLTTPSGDDTLTFTGWFTLQLPYTPALDPVNKGARVLIQTSLGATLVDTTIPTGSYDTLSHVGWKLGRHVPAKKWTYFNPTGVQGITKVVVTDKNSARTLGRVAFAVSGKKGSFGSLTLGPNDLPLMAILSLDAAAGECGEATFAGPVPTPACAFNTGSNSGDILRCR